MIGSQPTRASVAPRRSSSRLARLTLAVALLLAGVLLALPSAAMAGTLLRLPLDCSGGASCYVTAYYDVDRRSGSRHDYTCGSKTYDQHTGVDYGVGSWAGMDEGRVIVAPADGEVTGVVDGLYDRNTSATAPPCGTSQSCGNYVRLRHDDGLVTLYCHMKKNSIVVATGQRVGCGQPLGEVGSSGCSTGPHLHLGVYPPGGSSHTDPYLADPLSCGASRTYWVEQGPYEGLPASACQCFPDCSGRECGDDGCGGSCGSCGEGACDEASGQCMHDDAVLASEEPPNGEEVFVGEALVKSWTLRNEGSTTWTASNGYRLAFDGGERFGAAEEIELSGPVAPGETVTLRVEGVVPSWIGTWRGYWRMEQDGTRFGERLLVEVEAGADFDGDGHHAAWAGGDDCDDSDPNVYPGAPERCDGKDTSCNGLVDDGLVRECDQGCGPGTEYCVDGEWICDAPILVDGECVEAPSGGGGGSGRSFEIVGGGCGCSSSGPSTRGAAGAAAGLLLLLFVRGKKSRGFAARP